ncbi:sugar MFS transporter [uncultured Shewanella sp.]|uniref:sugar MFS transporter n=1 Tax=uncultured Shewanella sp. TaxID=173975 RepID=UPI00260438F6|nr:sugar MFS transporter [uncultured Shewanella sp.]
MAKALTPTSASSSYMGQNESGPPSKKHMFTLTCLILLFFLWGFITSLNYILIPEVKAIFSLNNAHAMLVQFSFFIAYFIVSLPAGLLLKKVGYKSGIILGLLLSGIGCLLFYPAIQLLIYPLFLLALFVLASGIILLQVTTNAYVTVLGPSETAASRLNLSQAFNSLGTTVSPLFSQFLALSGIFILMGSLFGLQKMTQMQIVQFIYIFLSIILFGTSIIFTVLQLPKIEFESPSVSKRSSKKISSPWRSSHLLLGAVAIFLYVGAEVGVGSFLIGFLGEPHIAGLTPGKAAVYLSYYWAGAMIGRFIGFFVLKRLPAGKVLFFNALIAIGLLILVILTHSSLAMWAIVFVGLCNSIMFPTIFSLGLRGLGEHTEQGSSILCLAVVGGALIPLLQGVIADSIGLQLAFILPLLCYVYIAYYGIRGSALEQSIE